MSWFPSLNLLLETLDVSLDSSGIVDAPAEALTFSMLAVLFDDFSEYTYIAEYMKKYTAVCRNL